MKTVILLFLAMSIPFPLCYFRMKKYGVPLAKMLMIYLIVSTVGFVGARFGPSFVGIKDAGVRLYGLVLFDFILLFPLSWMMKINIRDMGDFVAPPIMAVCASSKINCMLNNCCKGFIIHYNGNEPVFFPSALTEMLIWTVLIVLLLLVERKKYLPGSLWPILMIWFGIVRFLVDYLRGSEWEQRPYFLGLSGGKFWSLVAAVLGALTLIRVFHQQWKRYPSIIELLRTAFGLNPEK